MSMVPQTQNPGARTPRPMQKENVSKREISQFCDRAQDAICHFDAIVLAQIASPICNRRNGVFCFARRTRIAREIGCPRDVLNASIRRLIAAGMVREAYSNALGRSGLEIVAPMAAQAVRYE